MFLEITKFSFLMIGCIFAILLTIRTFYSFKNNKILPIFVSFIAGALVLYVINALILTIEFSNFAKQVIMLLFALTPFIIGKLVSYKRLKFYSILQILCVILSIIFVILY